MDALIADVRDFADRTRLAQQAEWRGLYRYAVELARPAAEAGQATAMQLMARRLAAAGHSADAEGWAQRAAEAGDTMAVQLYAKRLDEEGDRGGADAILRTAADAGDTSAMVGLAARLDEVGKTEDAERVLVQGAEAGDTTVMQRLAEHLDKAGRRDDATGWLRRAAETGDAITMQQLAARLDEDGKPDDAERWLVRAAEADDHFAHFVRVRLYLRLDEAGRSDEADAWLRRDIDAGETSSLMILAGRLELAGHTGEAAKLRQRARVAGEYLVLQPAIEELRQAGSSLENFENLLRGPAVAGDLYAMRTLAEQFDEAGSGPEADRWLADMGKEGNCTPSTSWWDACTWRTGTRTANGSGDGSSRLGTPPPWRTSRSGSIRPAPRPPRVSGATASSREELPRRRGRGWRLEESRGRPQITRLHGAVGSAFRRAARVNPRRRCHTALAHWSRDRRSRRPPRDRRCQRGRDLAGRGVWTNRGPAFRGSVPPLDAFASI